MNTLHNASLIVTACWAVWVVYWLLMWRRQKPITEPQGSSQRAGYSVLLMTSFILLAWGNRLPLFATEVLPQSLIVADVAALLAVVGVGLTIWARRILSDNWSADVSFKQDQKLVTRGPYAITRHPIYTGLTLMIVGTALLQGTLASLIAIVLAFVSFQVKLGQEEELMLRHYGADYAGYQRRTRRIIPFIY